MEKLVEEIGEIVCPGCVLFNPHKQKCRHVYWASLEEARTKCATLSKFLPLIARIGKAYADGELMLTKVPPKLPGEVGRDIVETFWVDDYLNDNVSVVGDLWPMLRKGDCVIALRPLTGAGKERKK